MDSVERFVTVNPGGFIAGANVAYNDRLDGVVLNDEKITAVLEMMMMILFMLTMMIAIFVCMETIVVVHLGVMVATEEFVEVVTRVVMMMMLMWGFWTVG